MTKSFMLKTFFAVFGILLIAVITFAVLSSKSKGKPSVVDSSDESMADHMGSSSKPDSTLFESLKGEAAPDFELYSFGGKNVKLSGYKGKNVVIFFSEGAMCQPSCWDQMKALTSDNYFAKNNIVVLAIVVDDENTWEQAVATDPELKNSLVLLDPERKVSQEYGVLTLPSSMHRGQYPGHSYLVLDKEGIVRNIFDDPNMGINNLEIKEALNKIS